MKGVGAGVRTRRQCVRCGNFRRRYGYFPAITRAIPTPPQQRPCGEPQVRHPAGLQGYRRSAKCGLPRPVRWPPQRRRAACGGPRRSKAASPRRTRLRPPATPCWQSHARRLNRSAAKRLTTEREWLPAQSPVPKPAARRVAMRPLAVLGQQQPKKPVPTVPQSPVSGSPVPESALPDSEGLKSAGLKSVSRRPVAPHLAAPRSAKALLRSPTARAGGSLGSELDQVPAAAYRNSARLGVGLPGPPARSAAFAHRAGPGGGVPLPSSDRAWRQDRARRSRPVWPCRRQRHCRRHWQHPSWPAKRRDPALARCTPRGPENTIQSRRYETSTKTSSNPL